MVVNETNSVQTQFPSMTGGKIKINQTKPSFRLSQKRKPAHSFHFSIHFTQRKSGQRAQRRKLSQCKAILFVTPPLCVRRMKQIGTAKRAEKFYSSSLSIISPVAISGRYFSPSVSGSDSTSCSLRLMARVRLPNNSSIWLLAL